MRLDKFLCEMNIGTRSQVKTYIKQGLVSVNDKIVKSSDIKIDENKDIVTYRGNVLCYQQYHYYMLNKPQDVVTATKDNVSKTVMDLLPVELRKNLFPVGRLDKDTEGLLLLTDDGELAHRLLAPSKHVDKTYLVTIDHAVNEADCRALEEGVDIGEEKLTRPAAVKVINEEQILLTIHEGKFHQVKRMLKAVGNEVTSLKRISFGSLTLDDSLKLGEYRELTHSEVDALRTN
uniref:pseudouridine synthase n=1 Tax=Acetatifactor sp. TaxID=1872090 RepID=UPI0040561E8E